MCGWTHSPGLVRFVDPAVNNCPEGAGRVPNGVLLWVPVCGYDACEEETGAIEYRVPQSGNNLLQVRSYKLLLLRRLGAVFCLNPSVLLVER